MRETDMSFTLSTLILGVLPRSFRSFDFIPCTGNCRLPEAKPGLAKIKNIIKCPLDRLELQRAGFLCLKGDESEFQITKCDDTHRILLCRHQVSGTSEDLQVAVIINGLGEIETIWWLFAFVVIVVGATFIKI